MQQILKPEVLKSKLAFIGGGNMARSLIGGLLAKGMPAANIAVADAVEAALESLRRKFAVRVTGDNLAAVRGADVIVMAVKPLDMKPAAEQLAVALTSDQLVISIAAGLRTADLHRWLPSSPLVRAMPNRPALEGCGVTGLYGTAGVPQAKRVLAEEILGAVGPAIWLDEEAQLDAVTAVSGSGPAYFFLLIEALEAAGVAQGLPWEISRRLAIETAYGSGIMAHNAVEAPSVLREQVTSKGGTTAAAVAVLEAANVRDIFAAAVAAAARRSGELADQLSSL